MTQPISNLAPTLPVTAASAVAVPAPAPVSAPPPQSPPAAPAAEAAPRDDGSARLQAEMAKVEKALKESGSDLKFAVDHDLGRVVVTVVDRDSGKVLRTIPSEEALRIARNLRDLKSGLLDEKT